MRQPGAEQLLGIKVHLRAETAADVRRYDAQQMFRSTGCLGDPAPVHVRHLAWEVYRDSAIDTGGRKNGAGYEASRNEPVVDEPKPQHLVCLSSRRDVIATASLEIRRNVVGDVLVELRCAGVNGCLFVDHDRQRLIGDINEFQCVVGRLMGLGDNKGDAFANKPNPVDGHYRSVWHHSTGDDPVGLYVVDFTGEIGTS